MSGNDTTNDAFAAACTEGTWGALMKHKSESMREHPHGRWRIVPTTGTDTTFVTEIGMGTMAYQFPLARLENEIKRLACELSAMDIWDCTLAYNSKLRELRGLVCCADNIASAVMPFATPLEFRKDKPLKRACENEKKPQGSIPCDLVLTTAS